MGVHWPELTSDLCGWRIAALTRRLCVPRARSGCSSGSPRVPFVCVCVLALPRRPPPPPWVVWRAHLVRSRHWALVGLIHVVRAPPRVLPRSLAPSGVLGGGAVWSRFLPTWLGLQALWGLRAAGPVGGRPQGGVACHCCEGRLVSGAVLHPTARPPGRAAGVARPVCSGCGRCGRGDPAPVPQRAPLRASVARCGAGGRASPGGGAFHRCEGRLRSGAPPPPTAHPLGGLLGSVTHMLWARVCGCGGPSLPLWPACPVGAACRGGGGGPSPVGWPATGARGVWCQALSLPLPPVLWGGRPGSRDPCDPGAVCAGVGTQHRPHSVRRCGQALLAVGVAGGRPRGGCLPPLRGGSEVRRSPSPDCPPTGRAVGVRYPRALGAGVWVWGPNTIPLAFTPCGGCVPRGWWGAVPGGEGACHRFEGCLVSGAVPPPTARPLGRAAGVPRPVCPGCSRCGRGDPAPAPKRAPLRAGVARCGGGGRAFRGGCLPRL